MFNCSWGTALSFVECCRKIECCIGNVCQHRDHVKLEGAWGPKIGVKLNAAISSKLGENCPFSGPFLSVREPQGRTTEVYRTALCLFSLAVWPKTTSLVISWLLNLLLP